MRIVELLKPTKKKILITLIIFILFRLAFFLIPLIPVQSNSMSPTFNTGDFILVSGIKFEDLKVGDIAYFDPGWTTIAHRVVSIDTDNNTFDTKGDANAGQMAIEKNITSNKLRGVVIGTIPTIGWLEIFYLGWIYLIIVYIIISLVIRGPKPNSETSRVSTPNSE